MRFGFPSLGHLGVMNMPFSLTSHPATAARPDDEVDDDDDDSLAATAAAASTTTTTRTRSPSPINEPHNSSTVTTGVKRQGSRRRRRQSATREGAFELVVPGNRSAAAAVAMATTENESIAATVDAGAEARARSTTTTTTNESWTARLASLNSSTDEAEGEEEVLLVTASHSSTKPARMARNRRRSDASSSTATTTTTNGSPHVATRGADHNGQDSTHHSTRSRKPTSNASQQQQQQQQHPVVAAPTPGSASSSSSALSAPARPSAAALSSSSSSSSAPAARRPRTSNSNQTPPTHVDSMAHSKAPVATATTAAAATTPATTLEVPAKTPRFVSRHCHQDKKTPVTQPRMFCSNHECSFNYCDKCIRKHYSFIPFVPSALFECPACRGICSCARCVKARLRNKKVRSAGRRSDHHHLGIGGGEESEEEEGGSDEEEQQQLQQVVSKPVKQRKKSTATAATAGTGTVRRISVVFKEENTGRSIDLHSPTSSTSFMASPTGSQSTSTLASSSTPGKMELRQRKPSRTWSERLKSLSSNNDDDDTSAAPSSTIYEAYDSVFGTHHLLPYAESNPTPELVPQLVLGTGEVVDPNLPLHPDLAAYDAYFDVHLESFVGPHHPSAPPPGSILDATSSTRPLTTKRPRAIWHEGPERKKRRLSGNSSNASSSSSSSSSSTTSSTISTSTTESNCSSPETDATTPSFGGDDHLEVAKVHDEEEEHDLSLLLINEDAFGGGSMSNRSMMITTERGGAEGGILNGAVGASFTPSLDSPRNWEVDLPTEATSNNNGFPTSSEAAGGTVGWGDDDLEHQLEVMSAAAAAQESLPAGEGALIVGYDAFEWEGHSSGTMMMIVA